MADIAERLEGYSMSAASRIGYGRLFVWKDLLFHPDETLEREIGNASIGRGAKDVFISAYVLFLMEFVMVGILAGAVALMLVLLFSGGSLPGLESILSLAALAAGILAAVVIGSAIFAGSSVLGQLFWTGLELAIARLVGGKGEYAQHFYLNAIAASAGYMAVIPLTLLSLVPCLGYVFSMISVGLAAYLLYIKYKAIRLVHGIGQKEAIFVAIAPSAVLVVLFVALYALIFFGFFAAGLFGGM